jgi:hypothetical protein
VIYSASYDSSEVIPDEIKYYKDEFVASKDWDRVQINLPYLFVEAFEDAVAESDEEPLSKAGYTNKEIKDLRSGNISIVDTDIFKAKKLMNNSRFVNDLEDELYDKLGSDSFLFDSEFDMFRESLSELLDTMNSVFKKRGVPSGNLYLQIEYANHNKVSWEFDNSSGAEDEFIDTFIESYSYDEEISIRFNDETLETIINGYNAQLLISSFYIMDAILYDIENGKWGEPEVQVLFKHLKKAGVMPKNQNFLLLILNAIYDEDTSEDVDYTPDCDFMIKYIAFEGYDEEYIRKHWLDVDKSEEFRSLYNTMNLASGEPAFLKFIERSQEKTAVSVYLDAYINYMYTLISAIYDAIEDAMDATTFAEGYNNKLKAVS